MNQNLCDWNFGRKRKRKNYVRKRISGKFSIEQVCILSQDNYYKPAKSKLIDAIGEKNFDLPESFKEEEYYQDVFEIAKWRKSRIDRIYTYNNRLATPKSSV